MKILLIIVTSAICIFPPFSVRGQHDTLYILRSGMVIGQYRLSEVDSIIFYQPGTGPAFQCGDTLVINHTAGLIAPVDKTAIYASVSGIPGETGKCWITSNLGSDRQATAKNDAAEASAGWYWQFNRKQGYKHDGTNRTPNTIWITSIVENSDWLTPNDPCNLELGTAWRLPTYTEWNNVANTGGWTNWNGPWNSGLKLHAAGYLNSTVGLLGARGGLGYYWSSRRYTSSYGWYLYFNNGFCSMYTYLNKATGFSVRCIRE